MAYDLKDAVSILDSGQWLGLRFITANIHKGTGGKVVELAKCRLAHRQGRPFKQNQPAQTETAPSHPKKDPQHNLHFTRNLELQNNQIIKVHPILITHINNQPVL